MKIIGKEKAEQREKKKGENAKMQSAQKPPLLIDSFNFLWIKNVCRGAKAAPIR